MFFRLLIPIAFLLLGLANFSMGSQAFQTMERELGQKFSVVRVERAKVAIAFGALGRANAHDFDSSLVNDQLEGVTRENLEGVSSFVASKLNLKNPAHVNQVRDTFEMFGLIGQRSTSKLEVFSLEGGEFKSIYGYVTGEKNSQGDVDFVYTIHQLEFKLGDHTLHTSSPSTSSTTMPSTTTRSTPFDPGFTAEEMEAIQRHYFKYEALLKLKQENVIESISYV